MARSLSSTISSLFLAAAVLVVLIAYLAVPIMPAPLHALCTRAMPRLAPLRSTLASGWYKNSETSSAASVLTRLSTSTPTPALLATPRHTFSTSSSNMSDYSKLSIKEAAHLRRSIYQIQNKSTISDERIKEIVTNAILEVPSSFNSQSTRLVVLVKEEHVKFWDIVTEILKGIVPEENWEHTGQRLAGFRGGYGTILFYEDPEPIKTLQSNLPVYADRFPVWSEHTSAMHQYYLWTALEAEGLGANLQHYNPLPDQKAAAEFNIPLEWSLKAQLVFGTPAEGVREGIQEKKQVKPVEERVLLRGF